MDHGRAMRSSLVGMWTADSGVRDEQTPGSGQRTCALVLQQSSMVKCHAEWHQRAQRVITSALHPSATASPFNE